MKMVISVLFVFFIFTSNIFSQNWFPLNIGNSWHYIQYYSEGSFKIASLHEIKVLDTVRVNEKLYYIVNDLLGFNKLRYSNQKLYVLRNNVEELFVDFTLPAGSSTTIVWSNGAPLQVIIYERTFTEFGITWNCKGIGWVISSQGDIHSTQHYWADNYGYFLRKESTWYHAPLINESPLEVILNNPGGMFHIKHSYLPEIEFQPSAITDDSLLFNYFKVKHYYDFKPNSGSSYFMYTKNVFVDYYYKSETDSLALQTAAIESPSYQNFQLILYMNAALYQAGYKCYYRVRAKDKGIIPTEVYMPADGSYYKIDSILGSGEEPLLFGYSLFQNYPNPFNSSTIIKYKLAGSSNIKLKVYNVLGKEVAALVNQYQGAGTHSVEFKGDFLSSGVYFYTLQTDQFQETKPMLLMK